MDPTIMKDAAAPPRSPDVTVIDMTDEHGYVQVATTHTFEEPHLSIAAFKDARGRRQTLPGGQQVPVAVVRVEPSYAPRSQCAMTLLLTPDEMDAYARALRSAAALTREFEDADRQAHRTAA